jgi:hypothetical protein
MIKKNNQIQEPDQSVDNHNQPSDLDAQSEEQQKLNAVRDLLFGQNVKEYRGEFDELKKIIKEEKTENEHSVSDLKNDIIKRLDTLEEKLNRKIDDASKNLNERLDQINENKADRKKIASILHDLASKLEA